MNCNEMRELASELYDGTLAARERATLERHLAQCGACRAELALFRSATDALRGLASTAPAAPAGHVAAVLAALPPWQQPGPRRVAGLVLAAVCGAAAMLCVWLGTSILAAGSEGAQQIASAPAAQPTAARPFPVVLPVVWVRERRVDVPVHVTREVRVSVVDPGSRRAALALGRLALALSALVEVTEEVRAAEQVAEVAPPAPERQAAAPARAETPVVVRREGQHLTLERRGGWPEVVPGLIDLLESEDPEVAVLAARELEVIQGELTPGVQPRTAQRPARAAHTIESLFGGREEEAYEPPPGPAEWRVWWQDHGLAALAAEVL